MRIWRPPIAGHLHSQFAPVEQGPIHGVHCILGVPLVVESHKGEASALLRVTITRNVHISYTAILFKHATEGFGRGSVRQIVHFQGSHALDIGRGPTVTHLANFAKLANLLFLLGLAVTQSQRREISPCRIFSEPWTNFAKRLTINVIYSETRRNLL